MSKQEQSNQKQTKQNYTQAQKMSYYSGIGYAVSNLSKRIDFKSDKCKQSFSAGYKKGKEMVMNNPKKYQDKVRKGDFRKWVDNRKFQR